MRFISLASSSAGNAYIVDDGCTQLLIECGVSHRKLQQLCRAAGYRLTDMAACLVTHEHKDHCRCFDKVLDDGIPVWTSAGTAEALDNERLNLFQLGEGANVGEPERFGSLRALPFRTFHDAREPIGFLIQSCVDGEKLAFATDTVNLRYRFPGVNILAVEANYADDILATCTQMPEKVVKRIRNTHMEIGTLCGWLSGLDLSQCRMVCLLHLSDRTSNVDRFLWQVNRVVSCYADVCLKEYGDLPREVMSK